MERNKPPSRRAARGGACTLPLLWRRLRWRLRRPSRAAQPAAGEDAEAAAAGQMQRIAIMLARELRNLPPPLSLLDVPPPDEGVAGARLAINDNNTTGRFLKQEFTLEVVESGRPGAGCGGQEARRSGRLLHRCRRRPAGGRRARRCAEGPRCADPQCRLQRRPAARAGLPAECRAHGAVTRHARATDWRSIWSGSAGGAGSWCTGPSPTTRPSPRRCGAPPSGSGRRSSRSARSSTKSAAGVPTAGTSKSSSRFPRFTQNAPAYDVLVVADESGQFGEYLPYRTWDARPVAGTQRAGADKLASGARAVGRDPIPEPLSTAGQSRHATPRLRCLGRGPLDRRGGDAHQVGGTCAT